MWSIEAVIFWVRFLYAIIQPEIPAVNPVHEFAESSLGTIGALLTTATPVKAIYEVSETCMPRRLLIQRRS